MLFVGVVALSVAPSRRCVVAVVVVRQQAMLATLLPLFYVGDGGGATAAKKLACLEDKESVLEVVIFSPEPAASLPFLPNGLTPLRSPPRRFVWKITTKLETAGHEFRV